MTRQPQRQDPFTDSLGFEARGGRSRRSRFGSSAGPIDAVTIPHALLTSLERSEGEHRRYGRGVLIGTGVGLLAGLVVIDFGGGSACSGSGDYEALCVALVGATTVGGGVLGLIFGSMVRSERWTEITGGWSER